MQKFWCGVVARDHGKRGEAGSYCQIGSGKKAPLARMAGGDGLVIYSPVTAFSGTEKCQRFTAIGTIVDAVPAPCALPGVPGCSDPAAAGAAGHHCRFH